MPSLIPLTTVGGEAKSDAFDYPVQSCMAVSCTAKCPALDATGTHAASGCLGTRKARYKKHSNVVAALVLAAKQAGLKEAVEPSTHSLLQGQFSKEECRRLFPKHALKDYVTKCSDLAAAEIISNNASLSPDLKQLALSELLRTPCTKRTTKMLLG